VDRAVTEPEAELDYPRLVRDALRDVPRAALAQVAADGLPAGHALYLTFATDAPGVELPALLRQLHPHEMTIVLESQFWDLEVEGAGFAVTLAFGGKRQRLAVPFAALSSFADPPAEFGLRFDRLPSPPAETKAVAPLEPESEAAPAPATPPVDGGEVLPFDRGRRPPLVR
jgi:hypothetical protein